MTLNDAIKLTGHWAAGSVVAPDMAVQAAFVLLTEIKRQRAELQDLSQRLDEVNLRRHYLEIQLAAGGST